LGVAATAALLLGIPLSVFIAADLSPILLPNDDTGKRDSTAGRARDRVGRHQVTS